MIESLFDSLTEEQQGLIMKHLALVIETNKTLNLTRIDTVESGMLLHIEDSLSALPEISAVKEGPYIDLGSGGGYPGIPLAIATKRQTVLLDARQKKAEALTTMIGELGLSDQITAEHDRIEHYALTHKNRYSLVTARALAKLSVLLEFASPLLSMGGSLVCYKAQIDEDEYSHAQKVEKQTGMRIISRRNFVLSDDETKRCIVVAIKERKPSVSLPRHDGYAQKKPL